MSIKQDRPGARTPADLERKYDFGNTFKDFSQTAETQSKQIQKLGDDTSQFQSSVNAKLEAIETDIGVISDDITALKGKVGDYSLSEINTRLTEVINAVSGMSSLPGTLSSLAETVNSLSEAVSTLNEWKTNAEGQISDLLERVKSLEST